MFANLWLHLTLFTIHPFLKLFMKWLHLWFSPLSLFSIADESKHQNCDAQQVKLYISLSSLGAPFVMDCVLNLHHENFCTLNQRVENLAAHICIAGYKL